MEPQGRSVAERSDSPSPKRGFIAELGHRHVWRAAVVYIGAAWALAQGIAQLAPAFNGPAWLTRWFVIACAIGFPFWIAFAWLYRVTPAGIRRETDPVPHDPVLHQRTTRILDIWIIAVLGIAVVLLLANQLAWHVGANAPEDIANAVPQESIAVLPLTSEGANQDQRYFSDGLSEGLITALSQFAGLKVIGSRSSFQFRNSHDSSTTIGRKLGVAHLLEGSIQYAGGRVRINAELIKASDGSIAWSHRYERPYKDLFELQDAITTSVASALKSKLLPGRTVESQGDRPPGGNINAYSALLEGKAHASNFAPDELRKAIAFYQQAIDLDPHYAYAYAGLAFAEINLGAQLTGDAQSAAYDAGRNAARKALELAPDLGVAHQAHAAVLGAVDGDAVAALGEFRRGLELNPHYAGAMANLANGFAIVGQLESAVSMGRRAIDADPLRDDAYSHLSNNLAALGRLKEAAQVAEKAVQLRPTSSFAHEQLANVALLQGNAKAVLAWADKEQDPANRLWFQAAAWIVAGNQGKADAALQDFVAHYAKAQPYYAAQLYALLKQPDPMFKWLRQAAEQPGSGIVLTLLNDPVVLPYRHDPRFAALCRQLKLPVPPKGKA